MNDIFKYQNFGFSDMIDSKEKNRITGFLEKQLFPIDFFENSMESEIDFFTKNLEKESSIVESLVHNNAKPANFSPTFLNNTILDACIKNNLNDGAYWFQVNIHDNIARVVEELGRYRLKGTNPNLSPLYSYLTSNQAKEGGTSYTGLIGRNLDWGLIIEFESQIIFKVIGPHKFCKEVDQKIKNAS